MVIIRIQVCVRECVFVCVCVFNNRLLDPRIDNPLKPKTVQFGLESENVQAWDRIGVLKPRTELCKQIIRIQDCVRACIFVYICVCVPLTIDYWTQGIITHRNSTVQITIRECSSLGQNWSMEAKDRTVQTNNQNPRLCPSACLCAVNNRLLEPKINNPQKLKTVQFRSESENAQA